MNKHMALAAVAIALILTIAGCTQQAAEQLQEAPAAPPEMPATEIPQLSETQPAQQPQAEDPIYEDDMDEAMEELDQLDE